MMPFVVGLVFIIILLVISNVRIVPQATEFVIERRGVYYTTWETGLHFKIPVIDRIAKKISLTQSMPMMMISSLPIMFAKV